MQDCSREAMLHILGTLYMKSELKQRRQSSCPHLQSVHDSFAIPQGLLKKEIQAMTKVMLMSFKTIKFNKLAEFSFAHFIENPTFNIIHN